jgi:putative ABC transport system permease protein
VIGALHGSLVEAWQELRIHKLRVLLSLVGVAIAVCCGPVTSR